MEEMSRRWTHHCGEAVRWAGAAKEAAKAELTAKKDNAEGEKSEKDASSPLLLEWFAWVCAIW